MEKNAQRKLEMTQEGLVDRIIETLGLNYGTVHGKFTPAEGDPLVKDEKGDAAVGDFSNSSVIGMMLYLLGYSRPDIAYAVNSLAHYMFCPKLSHEKVVNQLGRYLKATKDKCLILNPASKSLKIDCYPDADFAGMYRHESNTDTVCVKSRTGYVMNVANCPVLWASRLQRMTACSTMEAETIALVQICRYLFSIMHIVKSVNTAVGLPGPTTAIRVSAH